MEISEYDEYLPDRELDKNFKIPRKRTAEDSFGAQAGEAYAEYYAQAAQAAQLQYNQAQAAAAYAQYATLSGAASQATAYTNSKPPVPYSVMKQAKLDTSIQPPLPPGYATGTIPTNSSYSNQTTKHEIAAPNSNPYAPLITSTTSSQNVQKVTQNKNWVTNTNRNWSGNNITDSKQMGVGVNRNWTAPGSGNGGSRNWGPAQNRGWVGGDSNNSQGGNVLGTNRGWGGNHNRNWGAGNSDSGNFNSVNSGGPSRNFSMKSERHWDDSYESDNMNVGNSDRWGERENLGRNWGELGLNSFNRNIDDFEPAGLGRWNAREARETFGGGGGDYSSNQFGGRGRGLGPPMGRNLGMEPPVGRVMGWLGRGGSNNLGGRNQGLEDGFNDADGFEENRGFGMLKSSWNQKDFGSEPFDNSQQDCGGFAGRGRGGRGAGGPDRWVRGRGGSRGGKLPGASGFGQWQRSKERPKNNSYGGPVNIPDVNDASLPEELRQMFQPLYCKLCQLQMSSNIMAKMHYKSKNHEKKIRKFLSEYSLKTGEPLHPRAKAPVLTEKKEPTEEEKDPKYFHCEVCDLPLTGKLHAESHYMGRNHNAVVMGKKQPSGKGHYDENGKWIRDKTEKVILSEAEDSFGLAFRKKDVGERDIEEEVGGEKKSFKGGEFSCSLCCVTCTCQEQITAHFNGSKHKKKLKQLGISPENFEPLKEDEMVAGATNDGESASPQDGEEGSIERNNFSRYKTPSGYFYCEKCNLVLNSEVQLKQHLESKNHLKKAIKKSESKADPKSEPIISTEITT